MAYKVTDACVACGTCVEICPMSAITLEDGAAHIDKNVCVDCGSCAGECPVEAIDQE